MSTRVVTTGGRPCTRRKNYRHDQQAISYRRLITSFESMAFGDTRDETIKARTQALCVAWGMEQKLPCNNLRLIAGTLDERRDFEVRLADLDVACAESKLFDAKIRRTRVLHGDDAAREMYPESHRHIERTRQATLDVALSPVFTKGDLRRKLSAIGKTWLRLGGDYYDQLRSGVAADEERLLGKGKR